MPAYAASPVTNPRAPQGAHLPPCVLIVDANNTASAAYHVSGDLTTDTGDAVGVTYTMLNSLRTLLWHFPTATEVIYCWDSRPIWRSAIYPEYKMNRASHRGEAKDPEDTWEEQKSLFIEFLNVLPVTQAKGPFLEADDLAWILSQPERLPEGHIAVLVSNDKDWYQLIGDRAVVWRPMLKTLLDAHNFHKVTDYANPYQIVQAKAIAGDPKDNVIGAESIGESSALKYLNNLEMQAFRHRRIMEWLSKPQHALNIELLDLGRIPKEVIAGAKLTKTQFSEEGFRDLCRRLEFWSIFERWGDYIGLFQKLVPPCADRAGLLT